MAIPVLWSPLLWSVFVLLSSEMLLAIWAVLFSLRIQSTQSLLLLWELLSLVHRIWKLELLHWKFGHFGHIVQKILAIFFSIFFTNLDDFSNSQHTKVAAQIWEIMKIGQKYWRDPKIKAIFFGTLLIRNGLLCAK